MRPWDAVADQEARSKTLGWNHYLPCGNDLCWASLSRKYRPSTLYIFCAAPDLYIISLHVFGRCQFSQSFPKFFSNYYWLLFINQGQRLPVRRLTKECICWSWSTTRSGFPFLLLFAQVVLELPCNNCSLIYQKNPKNFPLTKFLRREKCSIYICLRPKFAEKKSGNKFAEEIFLKRQAPDRNLFYIVIIRCVNANSLLRLGIPAETQLQLGDLSNFFRAT